MKKKKPKTQDRKSALWKNSWIASDKMSISNLIHTRTMAPSSFSLTSAKWTLWRREIYMRFHAYTNVLIRSAMPQFFFSARREQSVLTSRGLKRRTRQTALYLTAWTLFVCADAIFITKCSEYVSATERCCCQRISARFFCCIFNSPAEEEITILSSSFALQQNTLIVLTMYKRFHTLRGLP